MLLPEEFTLGTLADAIEGLTLMLPRSRYENSALIIRESDDKAWAVAFDGDHRFASFRCETNTSWSGVLISNVSIEVDESSVFDAELVSAPLGALVRSGTDLSILVHVEGTFRERARQPIARGLPNGREQMAAGFAKWAIFVGAGLSKRRLLEIELKDKPSV